MSKEAPGVWREHSNAQCARLECSAMTALRHGKDESPSANLANAHRLSASSAKNYRPVVVPPRAAYSLRLCRQPVGRPVLLASHYRVRRGVVPIHANGGMRAGHAKTGCAKTTPSPAATRRGAQQERTYDKVHTASNPVSSTKVANWSTVISNFPMATGFVRTTRRGGPPGPLVHLPTQESPS